MTAPILVLHGGAGIDPQCDYQEEKAHLRTVAELGRAWLGQGAAAVEVAVQIVAALEESGLYIAGRGSSPNRAGAYELDAAVIDGLTSSCGAVAALQGYRSPIKVADALRIRAQHVLLAGEGAAKFAEEIAAAPIPDAAWFTPAGQGELLGSDRGDHGTVGCVVRDRSGALAAAVSTGGVFGKQPGRVGDTPQIGAGCWADSRVGIVCTGLGEYFIRAAAASRVAHMVEFGGKSLRTSCSDTLGLVGKLGGAGGMIAVGADGSVSICQIAAGLKAAVVRPGGEIEVSIANPPDGSDEPRELHRQS